KIGIQKEEQPSPSPQKPRGEKRRKGRDSDEAFQLHTIHRASPTKKSNTKRTSSGAARPIKALPLADDLFLSKKMIASKAKGKGKVLVPDSDEEEGFEMVPHQEKAEESGTEEDKTEVEDTDNDEVEEEETEEVVDDEDEEVIDNEAEEDDEDEESVDDESMQDEGEDVDDEDDEVEEAEEAEVDEDEDEEALDEDEEDEDVDQDNEVEEPKQEEKKVVSKKPLQKGKLQVRETPKKILKATPKKSTTPATKTVKETLKKVNHTPKQADTPAALRLEASDEKEVEEEQLDPLPLIGESHGCPVTFGIPSEGRLPDEHYNNSIVLEKKVWGASGVQYVTADWEFTYKNCQLEYDAYSALDILMSHGDFNNRFDDPKMFVHLSKADPRRLAWGYLKFPAKND
ncbi:hypothetical protein K474DRAFT_1680985, partial [Panus rudis PR-1116 ss-1]